MTTEVLILMTQDNQRSAAIAAYSLLANKSIYEVIGMQLKIINQQHEDWDLNDVSWAVSYADTIYDNIIGLV